MRRLRATGVSVAYRDKEVLKGVSMLVSPGELVAVVGPNGAGKSTLLKMLSGELWPTAGEVTLDGCGLGHWSAKALAERRALLPQHGTLSFPLTVEDVVALGSLSRDYAMQQTHLHQAMQMTHITHLVSRMYDTLSGGERQRVQLARVLCQMMPFEAHRTKPGYLMLDEPTSSLDLSHAMRLMSLAKEISRQGPGVVVVIHDLQLAAQFADRVVVVSQGEIVAQGSPSKVFTPKLLLDVFSLEALVQPHPLLTTPLLIPLSASSHSL